MCELTPVQLNNTSPFQVDLGTVVFNLTYENVFLGQGTSTNTQLVPGLNNITLNGRLVPHTDSNELTVMGDLFTKYLNGEVRKQSDLVTVCLTVFTVRLRSLRRACRPNSQTAL